MGKHSKAFNWLAGSVRILARQQQQQQQCSSNADHHQDLNGQDQEAHKGKVHKHSLDEVVSVHPQPVL